MARHLSFRSGNPALNKNSFKNLSSDRISGVISRDELMTINGINEKIAQQIISYKS